MQACVGVACNRLQEDSAAQALAGNNSEWNPHPSPTPALVSPEEEAEREASSFLAIFVCLLVLIVGTLSTHALRRARIAVPEAWVYVLLGALLSTVIYSGASEQLRLVRETLHDSFSLIFFAALLPVIIFESGYSMHKVREISTDHSFIVSHPCITEKFLFTLWCDLYVCTVGYTHFGFGC